MVRISNILILKFGKVIIVYIQVANTIGDSIRDGAQASDLSTLLNIFGLSGVLAIYLIPTFMTLLIIFGIRRSIKRKKKSNDSNKSKDVIKQKRKFNSDEKLMKILDKNYKANDKIDVTFDSLTIDFDKRGKAIRR